MHALPAAPDPAAGFTFLRCPGGNSTVPNNELYLSQASPTLLASHRGSFFVRGTPVRPPPPFPPSPIRHVVPAMIVRDGGRTHID